MYESLQNDVGNLISENENLNHTILEREKKFVDIEK